MRVDEFVWENLALTGDTCAKTGLFLPQVWAVEDSPASSFPHVYDPLFCYEVHSSTALYEEVQRALHAHLPDLTIAAQPLLPTLLVVVHPHTSRFWGNSVCRSSSAENNTELSHFSKFLCFFTFKRGKHGG